MAERFDRITRASAAGVTRRQALRRLGGGIGAAAVAAAVPAVAFGARPSGTKCGATRCQGTDRCCKIQGAHFCCPSGGLINTGCPSTLSGALNIGCLRVG
jgi:hypothetical protein